jgi:hypothetical protein
MTDTIDQSDPPKSTKGRFQKGHTLTKGRQRGALGKKTLQQKLLSGLTRSGEKKARKAGHNGKVDGFEFFIEGLADTNSSAAAALTAKLLALEPPPALNDDGSVATTINVFSIPSGHALCPDGNVRPNFEAEPLWDAHHAAAKVSPPLALMIENMTTMIDATPIDSELDK